MSNLLSIWWIRHDLRLHDNPALQAALGDGAAVLPAFIWSPEDDGDWPPGAASRWWLHHSLSALNGELQRRGSRLIVRQGPAAETLRSLVLETGAQRMYWNHRYEPAARAVTEATIKQLANQNVRACGFHGNALFDPASLLNQSRQPFQVFTPFWKACQRLPEAAPPRPAPRKLLSPTKWPSSAALESLKLLPKTHWTAGMEGTWRPGEAGALSMLKQFGKSKIEAYPGDRERPSCQGTSRLSPHLHFGEITPKQIWHFVKSTLSSKTAGLPITGEPFLRQLGWKEFSSYLLFHYPHTVSQPMRAEFAKFPWKRKAEWLRRWQKGQTGYPIVDAGMRELWTAGWMHNRVRMIVASFLIKDLLIHWLDGARWFWDTLLDADLANNTMGWQWTAGCGADAAPYFRIFNPVLQGAKFDPEGTYVRRWIPELGKLPNHWIHQPWDASPLELAAAGVVLGKTYPRPIVDHAVARQEALAALQTIRS